MATIEELEARVAELTEKLEKISPTPKPVLPENAERYLEMALARMDGNVEKAAGLFFAWTEQDSEVRDSLKSIIQEAIERRLAAIPGSIARTS